MFQSSEHSISGSRDFVLFNEDCLTTSERFPDSSVDLIYADPPFFSGRSFDFQGHEFADKWKGIYEYANFMETRLREFERILKPTGSLYVHCDWHVSHYMKVLADSVFGYKNFLNEIVWRRQSSHNDARQGSRHFGRVHDTILIYAKSSKYVWNQQYTEYDEAYLKKTYRHIEPETNRKYALGDLTGPGGSS